MDTVRPPSRFAWLQTWPGLLSVGFFAFIICVALAYVEENWRGDRVWAQTKAELEARGETFDRAKFIPPTVPDDQNFGALPYFKVGSGGKIALRASIDPLMDNISTLKDDPKFSQAKTWLPHMGAWTRGETTDAATIEKQLEAFLLHQDPKAKIPPGASPLDVFTQICPAVADLRRANAERPLCRFDFDYGNTNPWTISFHVLVDQITVAKLLSYDTNLALLSNRPDIALQDSQITWKIRDGITQTPFLISGLIGMGVVAIELGAVEQGLFEHEWTDAQLTQLDAYLGRINDLAEGQFAIRADVVMSMIPIDDAVLTHRSILLNEITPSGTFNYKDVDAWEGLGIEMFYTFVPNGWLRISEANNVRRMLDGARAIDPASRMVDPVQVEKLSPSDAEKFGVLGIAAGPLINYVRKFAYSQAEIDMARIACRLERYRLAHGSFPATLDALVPAYGADLPHDIMNGQPYIYRLKKDGNYTLYSVGWNQKDDGGDIKGPSSGSASYASDQSNDWLWPNHVIKKK